MGRSVQNIMERIVTKQNDELKEMLVDYKALSKQLVQYTDDIEKLENERNKVAIKGQKLKDKMNPLAKEDMKDVLGEFDLLTDIEVTEDGLIKYKIIDRIEQFKEGIRKQNAELQQQSQ